MSAVLIRGLSAGAIWGVPDAAYGKGQSLDIDNNGEKAELKDGNGNTVAVAYYDDKKTIAYTVKITDATQFTATRGSVVTVDGVTGILDDYKLVKSNSDFAEYQLNITFYASLDASASMSVSA